ncbi:MAG: molybdopterin-dependent oxidoreductase [Dehalococcoidia bacterium]|nr:molybdopterin-dependent oxidoreductase [Dehalococcoidia bacterium]MCL2150063.1 molybdopterin-dependent oxidoreductase [Dehalococcoidia bacterium]
MTLPVFNVAGKPENHDCHIKEYLTGKADYTGDHMPGRKLFGAMKHATIAHGTIKSIDATKALNETGVKAVITYKEAPTVLNQTILYWGQPVVGIVADDWYTACRAINLVDVTYDELPSITEADEALKPGAVLSGKREGTNLAPASFTRGDVDAGRQQADIELETIQPWTTTYQHSPIESYQALAWWIGDHLYVYQGSQNLHGNKSAVVNYLEMPANKVHCFARYLGGGHGARLSNWESGIAAFMSKAVYGLPVLFRETKKHNMLFHIRQYEVKSTYKWGAKNDGSLVYLDAQNWVNGSGAGMSTVMRTTWIIPHVKWEGAGIYINVPDRGSWRCVADPPFALNMTMAMDKLAEKLNISPYEIRRKNMMPVDMPDQDSPYRYWGSKEVNECFETVARESGYTSKWHAPGQNNKRTDGRLHGIGIHCHTDSHGSVAGTSMAGIVLMQPDGTALIEAGCTKPHNSPTMLVHFTAETLGMKYEDVFVGDWGNSDTTLNSGSHGGSAFTGAGGSAFVSAARDCRAKVFAAAITKTPLKEIAGITVDDLDAKDSEIFYKPDPTKRITFRTAMNGTPPIAGYGTGWAAAGGGTGGGGLQRPLFGLPVGTAVNAQSAAASVAEVAVDTDTGEVEILGHWNATGCGRVIFYEGVMSQFGSGTELQIAQALYYGDVYDYATGAVIGSQFTETQLPTTMDIRPSRHNLYPIEGDDHSAPLGAHGIGEPVVGSYACILSAIYNAIGVWVDPDHGACNPDKVLKALGKAT